MTALGKELAQYSRDNLAQHMLERFDEPTTTACKKQVSDSSTIQFFFVDDLLPESVAQLIYESFPTTDKLRERKTIREHKFVTSQMNKHAPQLEEALFAFHDPRILEVISQIMNLKDLEADPELYAGGISIMGQGNFLNPHLDNSHNNDRTKYRILNLLYYVSPNRVLSDGGNLEVWPNGTKAEPITIASKFNRLAVMTTGPDSWHSVSKVLSTQPRCCISNYYYFSEKPLSDQTTFVSPVSEVVPRKRLKIRFFALTP